MSDGARGDVRFDVVESIFFLPPLAIARIGGSDTPLDNFVWARDPTIHGGHRTVIRPAPSLEVLSDGSLRPYMPGAIQFRDQDLLRPVAPFFELWVKLQKRGYKPLTPRLLQYLDPLASLDSIVYTVTVANRKAQRRTGSAACAYIARESAKASDWKPKPLKAFSPHTSGEEPLVFKDHPIPLGSFQVIKPIEREAYFQADKSIEHDALGKREALGINLSTLRVRFTPAQGHVYGPPSAIAGPASPLPPGVALPAKTLGGRLYEIVPEKNRILNPNTKWSRYILNPGSGGDDPQPSDSYDGANVGDNRSWGVVDDTCDGIIEAQVVLNNQRFVATARVFSSCPDFAPDRRPFYSIADDLADRDTTKIELPRVDQTTREETQAEIADLFERAFETASLFNLDAMRERAIVENSGSPNYPGMPQIDEGSMTGEDQPPADLTAQFFPRRDSAQSVPQLRLPYAAAAQFAHSPLCDIETLLDFLRRRPDEVKELIRPPFGYFQDIAKKKKPGPRPNKNFRDPRVDRDGVHDMRMPPYLRDSDFRPLSLTHRQHSTLMKFIDLLAKPSRVAGRPNSPIAWTIAGVDQRLQKIAPEIKKSLKESLGVKDTWQSKQKPKRASPAVKRRTRTTKRDSGRKKARRPKGTG
jgi:hypothetical protein